MIVARIIGIVIGYLFGLFPTGRLVAKSYGVDLTKEGSGNTGMTNSLRVLGWKAGVIVLIGDCLKAVIPMLIVYFAFRSQYPGATKMLQLYAGLGAIVGHNFPFYAHFKGGKGIACSVGLAFTFDIRLVPICAILFFVAVIPTGYVSLGSLIIVTAYLIQTIIFGQLGLLHVDAQHLFEVYILVAILAVLAFWQHRANIKRLLAGNENKFTPKKKTGK